MSIASVHAVSMGYRGFPALLLLLFLAGGSAERSIAVEGTAGLPPRAGRVEESLPDERRGADPTGIRADRWKIERASDASRFEAPIALGPPVPPADYDAEHYSIRINVQFATQTIAGEVALSARSLVAQLARMEVDLRQNMTVAAVRRGSVPLVFTHVNDRIRIELDRAFAAGETLTVAIAYSGAPLPEGFGSFRFDTHGGTPVASTLSEPWFARNWWPCKEDPADKATADLTFTVPVSMTAVSNGSLESNVAQGPTRTLRWRSSYPIATYLVCLAATNYATFSDTYVGALGDSMPLEFYAYPEDLLACQAAWDEEVPKLEYFRTVFGEYPFLGEKYGIVEQIRGGIEHQTITGLPRDGLGGSILLSHELAHQWFGDMVTCATWHDIWLNEGFATFSSALWLEQEEPGGYAGFMNSIEAVARSAAPVYRTQIDQLSDMFNAATYERGAWVLHMLRGVLGDSTFFGALRDYRDAFAYASATTADYQSIVEARAERSLAWFFEEWIYGTGEPEYEFSWHALPPDRVLVHVDQVQTGPVFRMPIPIEVHRMVGSRRFVLEDSLRSQTFVLQAGDGITGVDLDPNNWILETHREVPFPASVEEASGIACGRLEICAAPSPGHGPPRFTLTVPPGDAQRVHVAIHDAAGRRLAVVADRSFPAGEHVIVWTGSLAKGVYFVRATGATGQRMAAARIVAD